MKTRDINMHILQMHIHPREYLHTTYIHLYIYEEKEREEGEGENIELLVRRQESI